MFHTVYISLLRHNQTGSSPDYWGVCVDDVRGGECREGEEEEEGAIIDSLNRRLADGRLAWCQVNENFGWFCLLNLH